MAKKVKSQAKAKEPKEQVTNLLARVPEEYVFLCHDGRVFRDMKELAEGLIAMSNETFAFHSSFEKHDFSNWVRDIIKDEKLASELAMAANRLQAAEYVTAKVTRLTSSVT